MVAVGKDFIHGLRLFVRQPGFAWAAVVTLALAIGANTVIFSMANVLVLRPLPIQQPERLGWVFVNGPGAAEDRGLASLPEYAAYRDEATAFARLAAWRRQPVTVRVASESERVLSQTVIGDLHGVWGLRASHGRTLSSGDEALAAPRVVVLSHTFWALRFGARPDVISQVVHINGQPHTVVGVLTADIELGNLAEIDLWLPHVGDPVLASRAERAWRPVGLLADGRTVADAHAQVSAIASRLAQEYPDTHRDWTARVGTTREALGNANTWLILALLSLVVGLLLLLACANITNLLIARLIGRRQELAVRTALGATRGRIVRQIVSESLLLGLGGGVLGFAFAWAGLRGVHAMASEPFFRQIGFDWRVVLFAIALSFIAPLAFAVLPTLRVLRHDLRTSLGDATARSVGGGSAARGRATLVVLQVSLAVTLLVVAGLVVQSVMAMTRTDPGYDPSALLTAHIEVPSWKIADDGEALRVRQRVVERARAIPGTQDVALTTEIPAMHFSPMTVFDIIGRETAMRERPSAGLTVTSTDYFQTLGIPIVAGRGFEPADAHSARAIAIVSLETARRYWDEPARAIGAAIRLPGRDGRPALDATVVGIARDTANPDLEQAATPALFVLDEHRPSRATHVVVRARTPAQLALDLRAAIRDVDPDLPTYQLRTVAQAFADEFSSSRLLSAMFAAFALIAVLLATAGLYGVMSYAVSQRTPEIAVRMALGASTREVAGQVLRHTLGLTALGAVIGLVAAFGLATTMSAVLFGVTAGDPPTYAAVAALTFVAAVVASWLPMRRAALVDPIQNLRQT